MFELLDEVVSRMTADDSPRTAKAAILLGPAARHFLLMIVAVVISGVGVGNVPKGVRGEFAHILACAPKWRRRLSRLARAG